jgi:hypothetical protein
MESYEEFIFMSDEAKENWDKASETQKNMAAIILSQSIREIQEKIKKEMNGQK